MQEAIHSPRLSALATLSQKRRKPRVQTVSVVLRKLKHARQGIHVALAPKEFHGLLDKVAALRKGIAKKRRLLYRRQLPPVHKVEQVQAAKRSLVVLAFVFELPRPSVTNTLGHVRLEVRQGFGAGGAGLVHKYPT